jgi:hypothetical protein
MIGPARGELAMKIDRLFELMHKRDEPPLTNSVAAELISIESGVPLRGTDLARLRSGVKIDPTGDELRAIATFFGVPESYLARPGTDPRLDAQLNLLRVMRDAGVRNLHMSGQSTLASPESLNQLAAVIENAYEPDDDRA